MIIKMKRVTLVGPGKIRDRLLEVLQRLGVVDLVQLSQEESAPPEETRSRDRIAKSLKALRATTDGVSAGTPSATSHLDTEQVLKVCESIDAASQTIDEAQSRITSLEEARAEQQAFGHFDLDDVSPLRDRGAHLQFWSTALPFSKLDPEVQPIPVENGTGLFVTLAAEPREAIPKCTEAVFTRSIADLESDLTRTRSELTRSRERLQEIARTSLAEIEGALIDYKNRIEYRIAEGKAQEHIDGAAFVLGGWCPVERLSALENTLAPLPVHLIKEDPEREDDVPSAIKNGPFTRLFEPITRMFMLPDYFELDLTAIFAPFFMLFFGLCLGDAAWGAIIVVASIVGILVIKKQSTRRILMLGVLFGISAIVVGLLTGTLLGFATADMPGLGRLAIIDPDQMFILALAIGIVQIFTGLAARTVNLMRDQGFFAGLYPIGTMLFLAALTILAAPMVADNFPDVASIVPRILTIAGIVLIMFFNTSGNVLKRMGSGVYALYNIVTGFLGDVLSYIRLFALGLAGSILGYVINQIGASFLNIGAPVLNYLLYAVFLIALHGFMLVLSALGAFVHPVRLTFVEFYKNAGYKGTLRAYKPFALKQE